MSVIAAGEALIDLAPRDTQLLPLPGGSPYNVAVGLARLCVPTSYLGRLSSDGFGQRLRQRLRGEGVDLALAIPTDDPTTLAVVHLDDQARASYAFYLEGTSAAGLAAPLPSLPDGAALHLSFGAIGLEHPAGRVLAELVQTTAGERVRTLDPNVRPSAISDVASYADRMADLVATCDLVKASDEDLEQLHTDRDPLESATVWASAGPALVVVTRGEHGAVALTSAGRHLEVPGIDVEVVDTVGAGDAFTAGLLAWLDARGYLDSRAGLDELARGEELTDALASAVRVAALTCGRAGAEPPTADELASLAG